MIILRTPGNPGQPGHVPDLLSEVADVAHESPLGASSSGIVCSGVMNAGPRLPVGG